ncbi:MAG: helix-turn-helix transcriptional regulator [Bacteroidales bacterium]|nr:helix-turn-helix transcriptional regulator [Bacteroidales bacterium]
MEYSLDIFTRNPETVLSRLAENCRARRLEKGYSRRTLSELTGVPAPTIEHFERTGKISLESFCRLAIEFDYYDELVSLLGKSKYTTGKELEAINKNKNRKKGR